MRNLRACVALIAALAAGIVVPARAQDCPGSPDALGTSRTLVLEPGEPARIGVMQYRDTLPLADKEVVLTFDDGPLPPYTNQILDILGAQCVKATFFLVGRMAREFPAVARRIYEAGHTVGTHSEDHPLRFQKLSVEKVRQEIDRGIADVGAALGDPRDLAPFFRIPGLARSDIIEQELAARSLVVFSSDTVADDWHRRIRPGEIIARAMSRLEKRGKGILLLHDIHPSTVAALPGLLKALKERGFRVVHVIAGEPPGRIETVDQRSPMTAEAMVPGTSGQADPKWPAAAAEAAADRIALPVPDLSAFDPGCLPEDEIRLADGSDGPAPVAIARLPAQWPDPPDRALPSPEAAELPAPSIKDFGIPLAKLEAVGGPLVPRSSSAFQRLERHRHRAARLTHRALKWRRHIARRRLHLVAVERVHEARTAAARLP